MRQGNDESAGDPMPRGRERGAAGEGLPVGRATQADDRPAPPQRRTPADGVRADAPPGDHPVFDFSEWIGGLSLGAPEATRHLAQRLSELTTEAEDAAAAAEATAPPADEPHAVVELAGEPEPGIAAVGPAAPEVVEPAPPPPPRPLFSRRPPAEAGAGSAPGASVEGRVEAQALDFPILIDFSQEAPAPPAAARPRRRLMSAVTQPRADAVDGPEAAPRPRRVTGRLVATSAVGLMVVSAVAVAVSLSRVVERERAAGTEEDASASPPPAAVAAAAATGAEPAAPPVAEPGAMPAPARSVVSFTSVVGAVRSVAPPPAPASFASVVGRSSSVVPRAPRAGAVASFATVVGRSGSVVPVARTGAARVPVVAAAGVASSDSAPTHDSLTSLLPSSGGMRGVMSRLWSSVRGSVAGGGAVAAAGTSAGADSTPVLVPHPSLLVGHWYHGDRRTKYGDSLSLVLNEDGTATATERRYVLDRSGWHVSRLSREGRWEMRYGRTDRLCAVWEKPTKVENCESVSLTSDSATDQPLLRYAGRHWRPRKPEPVRPVKAPRRARRDRSS